MKWKPATAGGGSALVILLVDDEPVILEILEPFLADCGHEVITATNGVEAMSRLQEHHDVRLVLSDIRMPEMDGLALLETIRLKYPSVPVVLVTGHGDVNVAVAALQKGAYDFIRKPVKLDELMTLLERLEQRVRLEAVLMQERAKLVHASRLATVGTMAAGIAHEINNPTTMIRGNLQTFQRLWERVEPVLRQQMASREEKDLAVLLEELPGLIANMLSGTERIARIVNQVKLYSRAEESRAPQEVDLVRCLEEALALTTHNLKGIQLERRYDQARVVGVAQELIQVFVNLLQNAGQALADQPDGRIAIEVDPDEDGWVCVSVADNGPGIPEALQERIFDPFFTTKEPGQGIGLGLSICHGLVAEHRGSLAFEPVSGGGACFTVRLPLAADSIQVPADSPRPVVA
jgi:signal transduction histidine kinase